MSNFEALERRIQELERAVSLEVRIVVSKRPFASALGGLRMALLVIGGAGLASDIFWLAVPHWLFFATALLVTLLPAQVLMALPGTRWFLGRKERHHLLASQALQIFRDLRMDATSKGNALLILFCTTERSFFLLPDSRMENDWSRETWDKHTTMVSKKMEECRKNSTLGIINSGLELLDAIQTHALKVYGPKKSKEQGSLDASTNPSASKAELQTKDELPNGVVLLS